MRTYLEQLKVDESNGTEDCDDELDGVACSQPSQAKDEWPEGGEGGRRGSEDHDEVLLRKLDRAAAWEAG